MSRLSEPLIAAPPPPRGTLFAGNLLQYINDNVVMMAMACTVSALGNHIGACILADTVQAAAFGLACDCATVVLLRSLLPAGAASYLTLHAAAGHSLRGDASGAQ